ncbi:MAG: hypothetical protein EOO41_02900, partial [Methanobacteriota archaeon]
MRARTLSESAITTSEAGASQPASGATSPTLATHAPSGGGAVDVTSVGTPVAARPMTADNSVLSVQPRSPAAARGALGSPDKGGIAFGHVRNRSARASIASAALLFDGADILAELEQEAATVATVATPSTSATQPTSRAQPVNKQALSVVTQSSPERSTPPGTAGSPLGVGFSVPRRGVSAGSPNGRASPSSPDQTGAGGAKLQRSMTSPLSRSTFPRSPLSKGVSGDIAPASPPTAHRVSTPAADAIVSPPPQVLSPPAEGDAIGLLSQSPSGSSYSGSPRCESGPLALSVEPGAPALVGVGGSSSRTTVMAPRAVVFPSSEELDTTPHSAAHDELAASQLAASLPRAMHATDALPHTGLHRERRASSPRPPVHTLMPSSERVGGSAVPSSNAPAGADNITEQGTTAAAAMHVRRHSAAAALRAESDALPSASQQVAAGSADSVITDAPVSARQDRTPQATAWLRSLRRASTATAQESVDQMKELTRLHTERISQRRLSTAEAGATTPSAAAALAAAAQTMPPPTPTAALASQDHVGSSAAPAQEARKPH